MCVNIPFLAERAVNDSGVFLISVLDKLYPLFYPGGRAGGEGDRFLRFFYGVISAHLFIKPKIKNFLHIFLFHSCFSKRE